MAYYYGCRALRRALSVVAVRGVRAGAGEQRADEHLRRAGGDDRVQLADQRCPRQPVHDLHSQRGRRRAAAGPGRLGQLIGQVPHPVAVAAGGGLVELAQVGVQDSVGAHPLLQARRRDRHPGQPVRQGAAQQPFPPVGAGQAE